MGPGWQLPNWDFTTAPWKQRSELFLASYRDLRMRTFLSESATSRGSLNITNLAMYTQHTDKATANKLRPPDLGIGGGQEA